MLQVGDELLIPWRLLEARNLLADDFGQAGVACLQDSFSHFCDCDLLDGFAQLMQVRQEGEVTDSAEAGWRFVAEPLCVDLL